jgi:hypothetical protein
VPQGEDVKLAWKTAGPRTNLVQVSLAPNAAGFTFSDLPASLTVITAVGDTTATFVDAGALTNQATRFYRVRLAP